MALVIMHSFHSLHVPPAAPSSPPQVPIGVAHSPTLVNLSWSPPPRIDINGDLQFYVVTMTEMETGRPWRFHAVNTFITIGALHPYYNYASQVAANTAIGSGPFTSIFYVQTLESGIILVCCLIFFFLQECEYL